MPCVEDRPEFKEPFDTAIYNAKIISGNNEPEFYGMLGIVGEKIAYVGTQMPFSAKNKIDAEGMVLAPGFIDIHGHSDFSILMYPDAESKLFQGVTTEVTGNCGLSGAPLYADAYRRWQSRWKNKGLHIDWNHPSDYFEKLIAVKPSINIAPLLGHSNLRSWIKGYAGASLDKNEIDKLWSTAIKMMDTGFWGISLGLEYPPGIFADKAELDAIGSVLREKGGFLGVHIRNEGDTLLESVGEVIEVINKHQIPLQISHLKTCGRKNWHKIDSVLFEIEHKPLDGIDVGFDRYPYNALNTDLDWIIPQEIFDGGSQNALERLKTKEIKSKYAQYLRNRYTDQDAQNIIVTAIRDDKRELLGKKISDFINIYDTKFWEKFIDFLIEIEFEAEASFIFMDESNLRKILKHSLCMIASDSSVRSYNDLSNPHPRTYSTFVRFLEIALNEKLLPIHTAIYKITGFPAKKIGLTDRGIIGKNFYADIVIFDPEKIKDNSSYDNPKLKPSGIIHVWVNGKHIINEAIMQGPGTGKLLLKG